MDARKEAQEYTENPDHPTCRTCRHLTKKSKVLYWDKDHRREVLYCSLGNFPVKKSATCKLHSPKLD